MQKEPHNKRQVIKTSLIERIRNWAPDTKLPTERELCEEFQVARMTINKALAELVAEKYLYRVQGRGTFVGCRPGGKRTIYFIGNRSDWNAKPLAFIQVLFMKMQNLAYAQDINVELLDVNSQRKELFDANKIKRLNAGDQVFLSYSHLHIPEMYELLAERDCQVVHMCYDTETHELFSPFRKHWHTLFYDRKASIKAAIHFLNSKGYKRIALLNYVCHVATPYMRGYQEGLNELGLDYEPNLIQPTPNTVSNSFMYCKNLLLLRRLYDFDAMIASDDYIALGAQQALVSSGLSVPDDIALLSMGDSEMLQDNLFPVSAIHVPEDDMLERAIDIFATDSYRKGTLETYNGEIKERSTT